MAEAIEEVTHIAISKEVTAVVFLILLVIAILSLIIKPLIKKRKWRKQQLNEILKDYEKYTTRQQHWLYIKTWFQTEPPHDLDEPYEAQYQDLRTNSVNFFIKQVLKKDNQKPPYYYILGGSGMGKSTFVVNLVKRYINR